MTERIAEKVALENKLRRALENDEFVLYYQPKVVSNRRMVSAEALIRWRSPNSDWCRRCTSFAAGRNGNGFCKSARGAQARLARSSRLGEHGLRHPGSGECVPIQLRQHDFVDVLKLAISDGVAPPHRSGDHESLAMEDIQANIGKLIRCAARA